MFDGARADLTKALSLTPAFQVTHSFALASQTQLPSYNFGAIFANQKVSPSFLTSLVRPAHILIRSFSKVGWITRALSMAVLTLAGTRKI